MEGVIVHCPTKKYWIEVQEYAVNQGHAGNPIGEHCWNAYKEESAIYIESPRHFSYARESWWQCQLEYCHIKIVEAKDYLKNNNKTNMIQQLTEAIKRGLKPELHAQYEAGFLNGGLERTEEGTKALLDILAEENQEKLNDSAKVVIAEAKKKEEK